jgi:hypothetical protein
MSNAEDMAVIIEALKQFRTNDYEEFKLEWKIVEKQGLLASFPIITISKKSKVKSSEEWDNEI